MYSKRQLVWFLCFSLVAVLVYGIVTTFVSSHAAKVIASAPPAVEVQGENPACLRARDRFQSAWDASIENGANASLDRAVEAAQREIDRACR